ncbi:MULTISPECIES: acyl-CoA dehydrogenase family protein [unclassified Frigoribacterium]|uniref:acyl-CoA dehydrogenase family protein n=1 Tax=unclassified Frigoribacterium TaxID=2627005 RepID=UPI000F472C16|nr:MULTISPECIES: acyl-CoA dehydrogenase family protein [unclassified Frigoribacterium]ROP77666.1 alkylation response protein AidB-like acyl-CoA dehydrogenase [Frigoribacterium sp. PhB107]TDT65507.1 alkylation response protein AidB-like acyl-CoA dehydrogenase [Frigoribacterium sp. PhB116]
MTDGARPATASSWSPSALLPDDLLARFRARAGGHDRDGSFPHDDVAELRERGYLTVFVPEDEGGAGLGLEQVAALQSRLAAAAPATALAVGMHLVWTGCAAVLRARGDRSLDLVLADAAAGEVFAFGVSEPGNDLVLFDSVTRAEPTVDGGWRFTGTKTATSLSPVWTRLGVFGRDDTDPAAPVLVHGFVHRDQPGWTSLGDWDTIGMRATESHSTRLDGVEVPASRIVRQLPVGPSADPLVFGIFAVFETLVAAVYRGIARRAVELAVESASGRTSRRTGESLALDPIVRWRVADARLVLDGLEPQVDSLARDVDRLVDHGADWSPLLVGLKTRVTEAARAVVDQAVAVAGGGSYRASSELGRLQRDVLAGRFHPSSTDSAHATIAARLLGPAEE